MAKLSRDKGSHLDQNWLLLHYAAAIMHAYDNELCWHVTLFDKFDQHALATKLFL